MTQLKVVFAGTPEFAVPFLEALILNPDVTVSAVMTQPDRPTGRHHVITPPPVKRLAERHAVTLLQPEKVKANTSLEAELRNLAPDLMVVVAYGHILPPWLLAIPRLGVINVHPSLLPRHRGASPLQATILAGDTESGVTIMQMDEQMDHGPTLAQTKFSVAPTETTETLYHKAIAVGTPLLMSVIGELTTGTAHPRAQDHDQATFCPLITKESSRLDWRLPATDLDRRLRAYYPVPVAWTMLGNKRLKVFPPATISTSERPSGTWELCDGQVLIGCGQQSLLINSVQLEGSTRRAALDVFRAWPADAPQQLE